MFNTKGAGKSRSTLSLRFGRCLPSANGAWHPRLAPVLFPEGSGVPDPLFVYYTFSLEYWYNEHVETGLSDGPLTGGNV